MKNIGAFITGQRFQTIANNAVRKAVEKADALGLPKAYSEVPDRKQASGVDIAEVHEVHIELAKKKKSISST